MVAPVAPSWLIYFGTNAHNSPSASLVAPAGRLLNETWTALSGVLRHNRASTWTVRGTRPGPFTFEAKNSSTLVRNGVVIASGYFSGGSEWMQVDQDGRLVRGYEYNYTSWRGLFDLRLVVPDEGSYIDGYYYQSFETYDTPGARRTLVGKAEDLLIEFIRECTQRGRSFDNIPITVPDSLHRGDEVTYTAKLDSLGKVVYDLADFADLAVDLVLTEDADGYSHWKVTVERCRDKRAFAFTEFDGPGRGIITSWRREFTPPEYQRGLTKQALDLPDYTHPSADSPGAYETAPGTRWTWTSFSVLAPSSAWPKAEKVIEEGENSLSVFVDHSLDVDVYLPPSVDLWGELRTGDYVGVMGTTSIIREINFDVASSSGTSTERVGLRIGGDGSPGRLSEAGVVSLAKRVEGLDRKSR